MKTRPWGQPSLNRFSGSAPARLQPWLAKPCSAPLSIACCPSGYCAGRHSCPFYSLLFLIQPGEMDPSGGPLRPHQPRPRLKTRARRFRRKRKAALKCASFFAPPCPAPPAAQSRLPAPRGWPQAGPGARGMPPQGHEKTGPSHGWACLRAGCGRPAVKRPRRALSPRRIP